MKKDTVKPMRPLKTLEKDVEYFRHKLERSENNPSDQIYWQLKIKEASYQIQLWQDFLSAADE